MADFTASIAEVEKFHKKSIGNANKNLIKALKEVNDQLPKFSEGIKQLEKIEHEKMAEGIEAAAKKSKMHFKATKALGEFAKYAQKELEEYPTNVDLNEAKFWMFEDFKSWLRGYNKFINNLDDERRKANKIMGLDYMIKRRAAEGPLNKLLGARDTFRDLLSHEFQIIKGIEDLKRIEEEISTSNENLQLLMTKLSDLNSKISTLTVEKDSLESEISVMENQGEVKVYRDLKVNLSSTELDIGHQINPLKKNFRLLSSKGSSLSTVGSFEIGVAKQYEDNTLNTFHTDVDNDFKMLNSLCEVLISNADNLKIKANHVHRLKQLQQSIESGKLKKFHDTTVEIVGKMKELEKNPVLIKDVEIIEKKRAIIESKVSEITKLEEQAESTKISIKEEEDSIKEKENRFHDLKDETLRIDIENV